MGEPLIVVNYGAGTNSTALLVEAHRRGIRPDVIVFADTGSEHPETYEYLRQMDRWLTSVGFPQIETVRWVRRDGTFLALHDWCVKFRSLPSKAFGLPGCTVKWKQQPADKHIKTHQKVIAARQLGRPIERWIGYDSDEPGRANRMHAAQAHQSQWVWRTPLIEWGMGRAECLQAISAAGLCMPGKSSCWLCPSMRQHEIDRLAENHPSLLQQALQIERDAEIDRTKIAGLGRRLNWAEYLRQPKLFKNTTVPDTACGCFDGGEA